MKNEKPILFNSKMVRAILDGRKTQTRRVWKQPKSLVMKGDYLYEDAHAAKDGYNPIARDEIICPYGRQGDRLWVREAFCWDGTVYETGKDAWLYRATDGDCLIESFERVRWTPSIYMPRRASRIDLLINNIRVERLNDISEEDAMAEGWHDCKEFPCIYPTLWFADLWDSINGEVSWVLNPWVWVVEFSVDKVK